MTTAHVAQIVELCHQQLHAIDAASLRVNGVDAEIRRAVAALERAAVVLRERNNKHMVRVLEAVRAGFDTSDLIAAHLQTGRKAVTRDLDRLMKCGVVTRLREPQVGRGRPSYRYRIVSSA